MRILYYLCSARLFVMPLFTGKIRSSSKSYPLWLRRAIEYTPGFFVNLKPNSMHVLARCFFVFLVFTASVKFGVIQLSSTSKFFILSLLIMALLFSWSISGRITSIEGVRRKRKKYNKVESFLRAYRAGHVIGDLPDGLKGYIELGDLEFEEAMVNLRKSIPELYSKRKEEFEQMMRKKKERYDLVFDSYDREVVTEIVEY